MKEEATKRSALYNSIFKLKKRLPLSVYDGRKPLYQAVSTSLPTGIRGRTAYLHCIKDGKNIDPCMGSGHILVYAFDVLMEIYKEIGFAERDAAQLIVQNNLYGLDIDNRAYQLAYFSVMMKARSFDRRFLSREVKPNVAPIIESNELTRFTFEGMMVDYDHIKIGEYLIEAFKDAKEIGSILSINKYDYKLFIKSLSEITLVGQLTLEDSDWFRVVKPAMMKLAQQATIMSEKYTVVCTNPPYLNKLEGQLKKFVVSEYKPFSGDLFSVFMRRNFDYCMENGYSAFMTPFVWMFIKTYEELREYIIRNKSITTLVQMEYSAFEEATVPICSVVFKNTLSTSKGCYIKLSDFKGGMDSQKVKVLEAIESAQCEYFYETDESVFASIPGMPIAYWISTNLLKVFLKGTKLENIANIVTGMSTGNNDKYLRFWNEVSIEKIALYKENIDNIDFCLTTWIPYNKGGQARKWYGNNDYIVKWSESANFHRSRPTFKDIYLREGLTWSFVTSGMFSARYYPNGFLWDVAGSPCVIDDKRLMHYVLAYLSTKIADQILKMINPTINCQVIDIQRMPIIIDENYLGIIARISQENINISKDEWDSFEASWDFKRNPLLQFQNGSQLIEKAYDHWVKYLDIKFQQLKENEEQINQIFINIFGLENEFTPIVENKNVTIRKANLVREIKGFISYAVGCIFGRYSLDYDGLAFAGGDWDTKKYSTYVPDRDNILPITDEEYFQDDIVGRFVEFVKVVYGDESLEENLNFIAKSLNCKGVNSREIIRNYFLNDLYKDHCQVYQKRPIYWLFDSGKRNGFKALVYMHRYDENTIGNLRIDYLHRMQRIYENEIARMQDSIENSKDAREVTAATKRKEKLIKQLQETKEYDEKIAHLALARTSIDLDDGVKVNYEKVQTDRDGKKLDVLAKI